VRRAPAALKDYFLKWFDVDRLIGETFHFIETQDPSRTLGTVIFHSRKTLGGK